MDFGQRVKELRRKHKLTKEEFCGDETELSVRQLTRIESGQSTPTLAKVEFIAQRLGVKIGELTDDNFELPERYKELKYLILRLQTYADPTRIAQRNRYFDEISEKFYDSLPEEEQIVIDCLQAKSDVNLSNQTDFGEGLLEDYFEQVRIKETYSSNDLIIIKLYFMCIIVSNIDQKFFDELLFNNIVSNLINQIDSLPANELFLVTNALMEAIDIYTTLKNNTQVEGLLQTCYSIMNKTQDFQKMPVANIIEWKYCLFELGDVKRAQTCYDKAILFSKMTGDTYLLEKLEKEWRKDFGMLSVRL